MKSAAYLVCIVADITTCFPLPEVTGWWTCMDSPPSVPDLLSPTERSGRFVAYDSNPECGRMGCVRATGRFERREVLRNDNGVAYATNFIVPKEMMDDFEPMDRYATSSCSFSRVISE